MIFVSEKFFNRQLSLLEYFVASVDLEIVVWMYPESKYSHLKGLELYPTGCISAEPITTYQEGIKSKCTDRIVASKEIFQLFRNERRAILKNCDSICLYPLGQFEWRAGTIGHEGIALIKNAELLEDITKAGFNASLESPSWY